MSTTNKLTNIIGISGKIGSGKNYIAEKILFNKLREKGKNVVVMAFGDYLKMMCYVRDGISYEKLFHNKDNQTRQILQIRGMKERETDDQVFIKMLDCHMKIAFDRNIDVIVVSDLRFNIEFEFLKNKNATLLRVNSPKRTYDKMMKECEGDEKLISTISNHISETDLDNCLLFDYYIDNDYEHQNDIDDKISNILNNTGL